MLNKIKNNELIEVNSGDLVITLSNLGASIYSIKFKGEYMTHTPKEFIDWLKPNSYYGKTIGKIAGRVLLEDGSILLHGGKNGLSNKLFKSSISVDNEHTVIEFTLENFKVSYLINGNTVEIKYDLDVKQDIYLSLTNHTYFTLGERNINNLSLKLDSDYFVEVDKDNLLPLRKKKVLPCLDFKEGKPLSKDINDTYLMNSHTKGYDHYLYFNNEKKIELSSDKHQLEITTDFDGVVLYSDNYFDFEASHTNQKENRSIAIEPQDEPIQISRLITKDKYIRFIKFEFK